MQPRRKPALCNSWRVACGKLRVFGLPASFFLWGYFVHYIVSEIFQNATPTYNYNVQFMTWCMQDVAKFSLTYFVFSLRLLRSLQCFRHIPECKNNVQLQCAVPDVMHAVSYEFVAHLLRVFSGATSSTIVFQRHSRMQEQRTTTMCTSWRDACRKLRNVRSPASFFLWGYRVHYSLSETFQNARTTYNYNLHFMTWCMRKVTNLSLTCFVFSLGLLRTLYCFRDISLDGPAAGVWKRSRVMQENPPPVFYEWWECVREGVLKGRLVQTVSHLTFETVTVNCDNMSLLSINGLLWLRRVCQLTFFER